MEQLMRWQLQHTHDWASPLDVAAAYAEEDMALLYSARDGGRSFLLLDPVEHVTGSDWSELPPVPADAAPDLPYVTGYIEYEGHFHLTRYRRLFRFHHQQRIVEEFVLTDRATAAPLLGERSKSPISVLASWEKVEEGISGEGHGANAGNTPLTRNPSMPVCASGKGEHGDFDLSPRRGAPAVPLCPTLTSNFTRATYESCIADTIARIHAGDFYQANITRKFWGEVPSLRGGLQADVALDKSERGESLKNKNENFEPIQKKEKLDCHVANAPRNDAPLALFVHLCAISPAPYSAYIRHGERAILSSSPECFLTIDAGGTITTRPIKGSARRDADPVRDAEIRQALATSPKNLAENLMITDLMRHDLSQVAEVGSVTVQAQSALHSYATIHHLVSTITAQKSADTTAYDVVRACFPPGSMTGAPKRAAMEWIAAQERLPRGIYSGALGWFGGGGSCDLSVVIRTIIFHGRRFEFQIGGGIVADSTPADEWRETLIKARAMAEVLGIPQKTLENL